jgi:hypothetical protein
VSPTATLTSASESSAPGLRRQDEGAEEVGGDRDQIVPRGEELAAVRRSAVEPALRRSQ